MRATKQEMRTQIDRWKSSGLSLRAFSKREKIAYHKLTHWRKRVSEVKSQSPPQPSADFIPVQISATPSQPYAPWMIWLPNGIGVEVPRSFERDDLAQLIRTLGSC